jgi:hypothetical protein
MLKAALLALISAAVCLAQAPSAAQEKGSVSGTVSNLAGEPVRGATLRLIPQSGGAGTPAQVDSVSSDAQGNFTFEDLDPGSYSVTSEKAGYLFTEYFDSAKSWVFDLASGEKRTGTDIKMTPQSVISGRVTDEYGDPYPNARVSVVRWGYQNGQKRLQPSGPGASTNAEGDFAIGNLQAASYYIQVVPRQGSQENTIRKGPQEAYVTTYYPGVADPSSAIAVQVTAGAPLRGMDIRVRKARAFRVRGKLIDPASGTAPSSANVVLLPKDGPSLGPPPNAMVRDGVFDFEGVLPNVYVLQAVRAPSQSPRTARQIVTVGDADVDDLVLQLGPGAEITGTIAIEGAGPQPQLQPRPNVQLIPMDGTGGAGSNPQVTDDGTFAIHNIMPAVYRVQVQPLPPGTYVKSIRFGSQDLMKSALDLTSGSGGTMNVVLSPNAGDISGIVRGADGILATNALVTLWTPGVPVEGVTDFTRTASSDTKGQFKFSGLPPGEYRLAAWEIIEQLYGLELTPEFWRGFDSQAVTVTVNESAHANIEAPLIGRDAIGTEAAKLQ